MGIQEFNQAVAECISLIHKCATDRLNVPDFNQLKEIIAEKKKK